MEDKLLDNIEIEGMSPLFEDSTLEDKPPIFKTWNQMYAFVLIMHVIVICLFYWLTKAFS